VLLKVPELAAEVDVRDAEMETDSNPVSVPADASPPHSDDAIDSDSDDDDDGDDDDDDSNSNESDVAVSVHSVGSSDSDVFRGSNAFSDENLNNDDDERESSVEIIESRTPSPPPADSALLPVEQTAVVEADGNSPTLPAETSNENVPASELQAENTVTRLALPASDLDNSLSCFKTTKRKKTVILSPPASKDDDDADEAEVIVWHLIMTSH